MAETILVIEDERLTRNSLINFLRSEGFETLSAENGRSGIQLAQEHLPDLIICDIMMPELDGYDVLTTLQNHPNTSIIPFIFLTVSADEVGYQQSLDMGADDYLRKPITSQELRNAIAAQLQKNKIQPPTTFSSFNSQGSVTSHVSEFLDLEILKHQRLLQIKDQFFSELCKSLLRRLSSLRQVIDRLQNNLVNTADPESRALIQGLQEEFTRLLGFVNEISVIQRALTPENAETLLEQFIKSSRNP